MSNTPANTRPVLYSWHAKRAGGRITIYHSCGKVPHVDLIQPADGKLMALASNGETYELDLTS